MKKPLFFAVFLFIAFSAFSQSNTTNDRIRELLEVTGSGKLGVQVVNQMIATYKAEVPSAPSDFWDEFSKEINPEGLIDLLVPIYAKHYTDEEIAALLKFYKSPIGQKVIEKMPLITQDSYQAGTQWGKAIGEKVISRLKEKGYLKAS